MDQKENCLMSNCNFTVGRPTEKNIFEHENCDAVRLLLHSLDTCPELDSPDFKKLWEQRKARNEQAIANAALGHSNKIYNALRARDFKSDTVEDVAAICIQKHARAFMARKLYLSLLQQKFEKDEEQRHQKQLEQVEEGELLIQNYLLQRDLQDDLVVAKNADLRFVYAASVIQHAWRKYRNRSKEKSVVDTGTV